MEFRAPEFGEGVHEGELVKWHVKVGDSVKQDTVLCEVMTDKATVELPAPFDGKITQLGAREGEVIKVGQLLATYEGSGATAKAAPTQSHTPAPVKAPTPQPVSPPTAVVAPVVLATTPVDSSHVRAAPATRKLARELGVELGLVTGTGESGRVMREDVEGFARNVAKGRPSAAYVAASAGTPHAAKPVAARSSQGAVAPSSGAGTSLHGAEEKIAIRGLRKKISERMLISKQNAAHFTYVEEADATELVRLRDKAKDIGAKRGIKVTYLPFIMKAMVAALRRFPHMNATVNSDYSELTVKSTYNIGLSIQTDDGLTAPNVKAVETKNVFELAQEINGLVERARSKKLTLDDLTGGTVTLTNAGSIGGLFATPVIQHPEVTILGFNKIFKAPVVKTVGGKDKIVVRYKTYFSISLDHRIVDGAVAAEFMKVFIEHIENPSLLMLDA